VDTWNIDKKMEHIILRYTAQGLRSCCGGGECSYYDGLMDYDAM